MKLWYFRIGIILSLVFLALFIPIRWKLDLASSKVAMGKRADYETPEKVSSGGYVLIEEEIDPKEIAERLDEKKAYLGAVEFTDGYESALRAEILRKEKRLFFRAFDPNPKGDSTPDEIFAKMRRAVRERSVDLIIVDSVPKEVVEKFEESFKTTERPFPHPGIPMKNWIFFIPLLLILASLSPVFSIIGIAISIFSYDIAVSFSSILSTLAVYKYSKKSAIHLFLGFLVLGLLTNASLSDFLHLNGVLDFRGVKVAFILLPILVLLKGISENDWIFERKRDLTVLLVVAGALIALYVLRSGNTSFSFPFERRVRDFLDGALWIRPRFKELFGYFFLFLFFKSSSRWRFLFEFFGSIALVTTFNTFCHIKAPIYTSIYRSFLALFLSYILFLGLGGVGIAQTGPGSNKPEDGRSEGKQDKDREHNERSR